MKKFLRVFIVILLTGCAVFGSYLFADKAVKQNNGSAGEITQTQQPVTEREGERTLLVEDKNKDYHFYTQGEKVIFVHKEKEYEYSGWSENMRLDTPKLAYDDMDKDGEEEILIQLAAAVHDDTVYHDVYVLNRTVDRLGNEIYRVTAFTNDTVIKMFDERIKLEITQDLNCPKNSIVAFSRIWETISYDRKTGIPDSYYNIFKTLQDENGEYKKIKTWHKGYIETIIDNENHIFVTMPMTVVYEGGDTQDAGFLKYKVYVSDVFENLITERSMSFVANKEYGLYGYHFDDKNWTSEINNSNKNIPYENAIDFIQVNSNYADINVETSNFALNNSDLNMITGIKMCQDYVELTAKKGCSFSKEALNSNQYSVILNAQGTSTVSNYDISYKATVKKNKQGNEVLRITFDKKYSKAHMSNITVNFGVR